jgi:purine catabolism regulator
VLTVQEIADLPELELAVAAGSGGLSNEVSWLHVSELTDPTQFLEGGEFLLTTGLGVGEMATTQRAYVRRLAKHGIAGLGLGLGFGFAEVPAPIVEEGNKLGFPVLSVPYEVPFVAITKAAVTHLASEQLEQLTRALGVHERLAGSVLEGRGLQALLAILCNHLDCSLALLDEHGRVVAERHARKRLLFDEALELPVVAGGQPATLKATRGAAEFGEYDLLVLHHGQTALALELSRLAGDLLEDLEDNRLDEREAARRMAAFGLEADRDYAALLAVPRSGLTGERLREEVAEQLEREDVQYLSTARRDRAAFLVGAGEERQVLALARRVAQAEPLARVAIGRPARGSALGRSLVEARAALDAANGDVASFRDLGSLELLLSLPDAALDAFVDRVLGAAAENTSLIGSLTALLDAGCRWSEAAERLGVHRHTLRYRMDRLREQTGRHPDDPEQRMELWLAVKARQAVAARTGSAR